MKSSSNRKVSNGATNLLSSSLKLVELEIHADQFKLTKLRVTISMQSEQSKFTHSSLNLKQVGALKRLKQVQVVCVARQRSFKTHDISRAFSQQAQLSDQVITFENRIKPLKCHNFHS